MKTYQTEAAPAPLGHYSQAVSDGSTLCLSTQLPIRPGQAPDASLSVEEQTTQVLRNLLAILDSAGLGPDKLLRVTLYATEAAAWSAIDQAYGSVLGEHKPARGILRVASLKHGFCVSGDAIASHHAPSPELRDS